MDCLGIYFEMEFQITATLNLLICSINRLGVLSPVQESLSDMLVHQYLAKTV